MEKLIKETFERVFGLPVRERDEFGLKEEYVLFLDYSYIKDVDVGAIKDIEVSGTVSLIYPKDMDKTSFFQDKLKNASASDQRTIFLNPTSVKATDYNNGLKIITKGFYYINSIYYGTNSIRKELGAGPDGLTPVDLIIKEGGVKI